jgi:hypothetical protein
MINATKHEAAMKVIQFVVTRARGLAYDISNGEKNQAEGVKAIADILDGCDALCGYLLTKQDETANFSLQVEGLVESHSELQHIVEIFSGPG